jgi:hypothetical protein
MGVIWPRFFPEPFNWQRRDLLYLLRLDVPIKVCNTLRDDSLAALAHAPEHAPPYRHFLIAVWHQIGLSAKDAGHLVRRILTAIELG